MKWLRHKLLARLQSRLSDGSLPLRLVFWDGERYDFARQPAVTVTLRSQSLMRHLLTGNMARLGDAYVAGEVVVEGAVEDILRTGIDLAERIGSHPIAAGIARRVGALRPRHRRVDDAAAIHHHYDVSNDFYRLWLDREMVYSCGYFRTGSDDIHLAQEQKLDHLCRKLRLQPGEHLLDVGCGWGGLLRWACTHYGVRGTGITLSERQFQYAQERIAAEGLADRIDIRLQDYRDLPGDDVFDKVVSVGMYEHVGLNQMSNYFSILARLVKPGGAVLNHGIIVPGAETRPHGPPGGEFIDRYVFPGGELPNLPQVLTHVAQSGLEAVDVEDLRPHYARTLQHWVNRLETRRAEAIAAAGAERYRIWRIFLAGMAFAFDRRWLSIAQVLAYKAAPAGPAARPWTRKYQYDAAAPVALADRLDWSRQAPPLCHSDDGTSPDRCR
jgi:cyclopropane-fatty-acyl-phospholipid synthase